MSFVFQSTGLGIRLADTCIAIASLHGTKWTPVHIIYSIIRKLFNLYLDANELDTTFTFIFLLGLQIPQYVILIFEVIQWLEFFIESFSSKADKMSFRFINDEFAKINVLVKVSVKVIEVITLRKDQHRN